MAIDGMAYVYIIIQACPHGRERRKRKKREKGRKREKRPSRYRLEYHLSIPLDSVGYWKSKTEAVKTLTFNGKESQATWQGI